MREISRYKIFVISVLFYLIVNLGVTVDAVTHYCDPEYSVVGEFGQCIAICGEGLILEDGKCIKETFEPESWEDNWLGIGVILAAFATGAGILLAWGDRKKEREKRTQELIQTYDEELREIADQEKNLTTKLECSIYVERYLDTVEKIASLSLANNFQGSVSDFFENNFSYAIELWRWYQKNVVHINPKFIGVDEDLGPIWTTSTEFKRDQARYYPAELKKQIFNEFKKKYLEFHKIEEGKFDKEFLTEEFEESLFKYYDNERWREFRTWCNRTKLGSNKNKNILSPLPSNFGLIQDEDERKRQETKGAHSGKYRILPEVLHEQYEDIPEENGLTKGELVEIIRGFGKDLSKIGEMEQTFRKDEDCSIYAEQFLDTLEEISSLYRSDMIPRRAANYFENKFSYGRNLWDWYLQKVLFFSKGLRKTLWIMDDKNPTIKDEFGNVDKDKSEIENEKNIKKFIFYLNKSNEKKDLFLDTDLSVEEKNSFLDRNLSDNDYENSINIIIEKEEDASLKLIFPIEEKSNLTIKEIIKNLNMEERKKILRVFIEKHIKNERWRDFRWWCKKQKITSFEEDETIGLILPRRMWEVNFEKGEKNGESTSKNS